MTVGLTAKLAASLIGDFTASNDLSSPNASFNEKMSMDFQPGTGTGKANKVFADRRTLAASATENLDLSGALVDPLGGAAVFTKIKAVIIEASEDNTNDVIIGGNASGATALLWFGDLSDTAALKPGAFMIHTATGNGWAITDSTADKVKVTNGGSGTGVDYSITVIGE